MRSPFPGRTPMLPPCLAVLAASIAITWLSPARADTGPDALAAYLAHPDDSFAWKKTEEREINGLRGYRLEVTSQTWRSNAWKHEILVARPPRVRHPEVALLLIGGSGPVDRSWGLLRAVAERGGALAAAINEVPNQPLFGGLREDALIAYTFDQELKSGDTTWPLLFPMVKSAVRGMDAVQAFAKKELDAPVAQFVVCGASKRGWTTWLTAAQDKRVAAIAPMVIDVLNMPAQTKWAAQMYGRQSERIRDYTEYNFMDHLDEPAMQRLLGWVDPYSYRTRYKMPKLLLLGTNDPYWVVDSLRHYWSDLPEPKLIFQTPNAGHNLGGFGQATQTLAAFFEMVADHLALPHMTWRFRTNSAAEAALEVQIDRPVKQFRLWTATSPKRDFRESHWSSVVMASTSGTNVVAVVETPKEGFRAYLVEAELAAPGGQTYKLSTEARVTPDGPPSAGQAIRQ